MKRKSFFKELSDGLTMTELKSFIMQWHTLILSGVIFSIFGCFLYMVVSKSQIDSVGIYSDLFNNRFFGKLADLFYRAISGYSTSSVLTVGVFVGDFKYRREFGLTMLAWGCAEIWLYKKNRYTSGLISACVVVLINIITLIDFYRLNTGDTEFFYTSKNVSFGMGYKMLLFGTLLIIAGIFVVYKPGKNDLLQIFQSKKTRIALICSWGIVLVKTIFNISVPITIIIAIFNASSLYLVLPYVKSGK